MAVLLQRLYTILSKLIEVEIWGLALVPSFPPHSFRGKEAKLAQNGNGKKGSGLNKGCYLFVVFIFAILLSLAIFLGYLYFEGSLDAFKQDPVKWFSGEIKDEPTVEPIPPITPPAQEIESIEPNDVVPFELTDTPYPGFG